MIILKLSRLFADLLLPCNVIQDLQAHLVCSIWHNMKRAAAVGILGFVLLHSCTVASPEPYRSWKTYDGNMATAIRRSLTQAPNHEALAAKETFTLPHQCKIVQSNTTSECFRTCMTCQLTHRNPDMRPCTCCKAGYHPIAKVGRCWVCPLGTFSGPGQSECTACPTGLSTVSHGSSVCNGESTECDSSSTHSCNTLYACECCCCAVSC